MSKLLHQPHEHHGPTTYRPCQRPHILRARRSLHRRKHQCHRTPLDRRLQHHRERSIRLILRLPHLQARRLYRNRTIRSIPLIGPGIRPSYVASPAHLHLREARP